MATTWSMLIWKLGLKIRHTWASRGPKEEVISVSVVVSWTAGQGSEAASVMGCQQCDLTPMESLELMWSGASGPDSMTSYLLSVWPTRSPWRPWSWMQMWSRVQLEGSTMKVNFFKQKSIKTVFFRHQGWPVGDVLGVYSHLSTDISPVRLYSVLFPQYLPMDLPHLCL